MLSAKLVGEKSKIALAQTADVIPLKIGGTGYSNRDLGKARPEAGWSDPDLTDAEGGPIRGGGVREKTEIEKNGSTKDNSQMRGRAKKVATVRTPRASPPSGKTVAPCGHNIAREAKGTYSCTGGGLGAEQKREFKGVTKSR